MMKAIILRNLLLITSTPIRLLGMQIQLGHHEFLPRQGADGCARELYALRDDQLAKEKGKSYVSGPS
jgi:hypothetical protein